MLKGNGSLWKSNGGASWALQEGLVEMAARERERVYAEV